MIYCLKRASEDDNKTYTSLSHESDSLGIAARSLISCIYHLSIPIRAL